jgi:hypothetical protein
MRIRNHIRSNVVGYLALFFAFSGSVAYATHPGGANTIDSGDIINGQVTEPDIATNAVRSAEVLNDSAAGGGLEQQDLQASSVGGSEIRANAVAGGEVENDSLDSVDLGPNSVTNSEMADGSVGTAEVIDDTGVGGGLAAEDLQTNSVGSSEIQTDAVQATEIANDSIDSGEIVDFGLSNQDVGVLFAQVNANGTLANSSGGVAVTKLAGLGTYEVDYGRNISSCAFITTQGGAGVGSSGGAITANTDRSGNVEATFTTTRTDANALADRDFQQVVVC